MPEVNLANNIRGGFPKGLSFRMEILSLGLLCRSGWSPKEHFIGHFLIDTVLEYLSYSNDAILLLLFFSSVN